MNVTRRDFMKLAAAGAVGTMRWRDYAAEVGMSPLRVGVLSDIHVSWRLGSGKSADRYGAPEYFLKTLESLRDAKVDAVIIAGDLTNYGDAAELQVVGEVWDKVFPGNRRPDGAEVVKLFLHGNHDVGFSWTHKKDFTTPEAKAALFEKSILKDRAGTWQAAFHEAWSPVYMKDVKGYKVDILNLMEDDDSGVAAAPAKAVLGSDNTTTYQYGTLYHKGGAKMDFSNTTTLLTVTGNSDETFNQTAQDHIKFAIPTGILPEEKTDAKASATNYYVIPANDDNTKTGLTFHVTYKLTSEDTGETIIVRNATVHVKYDYCKWQPNYVYTYIFRITKSSTGSTGSPVIDPSDPSVGEQALYPIIFDDCTVEDWQNATETETPVN